MRMTILLTLGLMLLFVLLILTACVFLPSASLLSFWPEDIQERLKPRVAGAAMTPKRIAGIVLFLLIGAGMAGIFVLGGIDGIRTHFTYGQFLLRFLVIGVSIKAFDIIGFDWFLMTKTHFFQHFFPETEGCAGWQQFGYNRRQQIRQCILILVSAPVTAAVFWIIGG